MIDHDWEAAEQEFHKALTSSSVSADVYYQYTSGFLMAMQRFEEASIAIERARQLDPLVPVFAVSASAVHCSMGNFQRAMDDCDKALELDERFWLARLNKAEVLIEMGNTAKALTEFELVQQQIGFDNPFVLSKIAACFARDNREDQARAILARLLEERTRTYGAPWMLGNIYYSLGDLEQAFACMNEACDEHDPRVLWFVADPGISTALGTDTRFQSLLRRMNLPMTF
jgi:tetratricopeptide (TPR) repeat protein